MAGIRSKLTRSTVVLVLFWGTILTVAFMSMGPDTLTSWLTLNGMAPSEAVTPINLFSVSVHVIYLRLLKTWFWLAGGLVFGVGIVWLLIILKIVKRNQRGKQHKERYRDIGVSISELVQYKNPEGEPINGLKFPKDISKSHQPLLRDILEYLNAHKDAFVGDGHDTTLLKHTLNVIAEAQDYPGADDLLILAAAAHDIGKVVSMKRDGKEWKRNGLQDDQGARLLSKFDKWWALPDVDRAILIHAVRYEHNPKNLPYVIPGLNVEEVKRTKKLLGQLRTIDGIATSEEKERVLEKIDVNKAVESAFMRALAEMPFQVRGLARGVRAAGWRQGDKLFILEHRLRDLSGDKMDADQAAALDAHFRESGGTSRFSDVLFKVLEDKGWLVKTLDVQETPDNELHEETVKASFPLWRVKAGTMEFNGVVAIELPEDMRHIYPQESQYTLIVAGKLREKKANEPNSKKRGGNKKAKPTKPATRSEAEVKAGAEEAKRRAQEALAAKPKKEALAAVPAPDEPVSTPAPADTQEGAAIEGEEGEIAGGSSQDGASSSAAVEPKPKPKIKENEDDLVFDDGDDIFC